VKTISSLKRRYSGPQGNIPGNHVTSTITFTEEEVYTCARGIINAGKRTKVEKFY
jgi:hypothetical protein